MARVHIIGTGGTIASRGSGQAGAVASDAVTDLLPAGLEDTELTSEDVLTLGSYRLGLPELRQIATAVLAAARRPDVDGVVVTHGTDTLEETAFLLDLVNDTGTTAVLTGAQRAADQPDTDGPRNVRQAIAVAADPRFRGMGALISFDGVVQGARGARKAHTLASQPFAGGADVGSFAGEDLVLVARPERRGALPLPGAGFDRVRVDVVPAYPGSTPDVLHRAAEAGAAGVVLAGTGVGNAGPGHAEAVAELTAAGVPVVLSTRVPGGPVVPLYGNGGGVDILAAGAVSAGSLNPFQARILAACLLAEDLPTAAFGERFSEFR